MRGEHKVIFIYCLVNGVVMKYGPQEVMISRTLHMLSRVPGKGLATDKS